MPMRLYTIMQNDKEQVAVDIDEKLMTLDSLGIKVADMNELIIRFDELKEEKKDFLTGYNNEYFCSILLLIFVF